MGVLPDESSAGERVLVGLSRLGTVLRSQAWEGSTGTGIHPTQAQILVYLARSRPPGLRLSELADRLAVNRSTASESVTALQRKGLLERGPDPTDGRATRIELTPAGEKTAADLGEWPDLLLEAVDELDPVEKGVLLRLLTRLIRGLQLRGEITPQRMCLTCRFFQPNAHDDPQRPHHCGYVDAAFGDPQLRIDCPEHEPAEAGSMPREALPGVGRE